MMFRHTVAAFAAALAVAGAWAADEPVARPGSFADNPIVYFVVTDRFANGNPANDGSYGRTREPRPQDDIGTFHGGDLAGLTQKLREGWFRELGVNAIWITAPYEQMHGWVVGGSKEFKHYGYHGYFALDYTRLDANMGTPAELREFVATAHAQGIRVVFDVVMNHPGYGDIQSLSEYVTEPETDKKRGMLWKGYEAATLRDYHSWIDYNDPAWLQWWGPDWIRSGLRGYTEGGSDDLTKQLAFLPDFKTESPKAVGLPPFLKKKADTEAVELPDTTVRGYLVAWLSRWVREYGVDGFRADTVKHVEYASWTALKEASAKALADWKAANPKAAVDAAPFWMTGEDWGHDTTRTRHYDIGFDNMINFDFQRRADARGAELDKLYAEYARALAAPATHNVLSYISSHDTKLFDRKALYDGATALMLAPGGVQIYYGDETARPDGPAANGDPQQSTRSDMNWAGIDAALLSHWRKLGQFRARHVAVAKGRHWQITAQPYTFARVHAEDRIVAAVGAAGRVTLAVGDVFPDGTRVRDAYGGTSATVAAGKVTLDADARGLVLLEALP
ncbi:alpha-amylase [Rubrivivax gelatinosus]|uniref:alpha-amylase family glycosyl hydrolase n=1 Tax=Rubrivivax gelatinosus TaxID=28068 RepID=UPI0019083CE2|nr:alpha-amylase family glycosyl hydrolase [Rubrivivax gelatinosus]MBK1614936.1 alpha-amylase [Rubrivivax gelatinosus]